MLNGEIMEQIKLDLDKYMPQSMATLKASDISGELSGIVKEIKEIQTKYGLKLLATIDFKEIGEKTIFLNKLSIKELYNVVKKNNGFKDIKVKVSKVQAVISGNMREIIIVKPA
jgi:hypothetical protein